MKGKLKLMLLIYDVDYDDDITEIMSSGIITGFTKWDRVLGSGQRSDPKMDTAVWPGHNCAILSMLNSENEKEFIAKIQAMIEKHMGSGIKLFVLPLLEVM